MNAQRVVTTVLVIAMVLGPIAASADIRESAGRAHFSAQSANQRAKNPYRHWAAATIIGGAGVFALAAGGQWHILDTGLDTCCSQCFEECLRRNGPVMALGAGLVGIGVVTYMAGDRKRRRLPTVTLGPGRVSVKGRVRF